MNKHGFFKTEDGILKGKGVSAVRQSRQNYNEILAMFGGVKNLPSSVMKADRMLVKADTDQAAFDRGYTAISKNKEKERDGKLPEEMRKAFRISGKGCHSGALSVFPQNIGRSMVLLYSEPESVVFDPFAGHNSRMELTVRANRDYIGCDLSRQFMRFNRRRRKDLLNEFPSRRIRLIEGDSRSVPLPDACADFTITSPPYWDIEYYGPENGQLGNSETYEEFLGQMMLVMQENYRILKDGSYAVYFLNDFRKGGKMYFYHCDMLSAGEEVGFVPHDILIVDFHRAFRECFPNQTIASRLLPKRHEYGLVFYKGEIEHKDVRGAQRRMRRKKK